MKVRGYQKQGKYGKLIAVFCGKLIAKIYGKVLAVYNTNNFTDFVLEYTSKDEVIWEIFDKRSLERKYYE